MRMHQSVNARAVFVFAILAVAWTAADAWTVSGTGELGPVYQQDDDGDLSMIGTLTSDGYDEAGSLAENHAHALIENLGKEPAPFLTTQGGVSDSMTISVQWNNVSGDSATFKHDYRFTGGSSGQSIVARATFKGDYEIKVTQYAVTLDGLPVYTASVGLWSYTESLSGVDQLPHFVMTPFVLSALGGGLTPISMTSSDCCLKTVATLEYTGSWKGVNSWWDPEFETFHQVCGSGKPNQGGAMVEAMLTVSLTKQ